MKPGRVPGRTAAQRLMDAAIDFAGAVEAEASTAAEWDRLRRAALAYRDGPRPTGRPRGPEHVSTVMARALEGVARKAEG